MICDKPQKPKFDKSKKLNLWQKSKIQILTTQKDQLVIKLKTQVLTTQKLKLWEKKNVTKLKNLKCDKTQNVTPQKLKLSHNSKTHV